MAAHEADILNAVKDLAVCNSQFSRLLKKLGTCFDKLSVNGIFSFQ
jgi:hypothetical protein